MAFASAAAAGDLNLLDLGRLRRSQLRQAVRAAVRMPRYRDLRGNQRRVRRQGNGGWCRLRSRLAVQRHYPAAHRCRRRRALDPAKVPAMKDFFPIFQAPPWLSKNGKLYGVPFGWGIVRTIVRADAVEAAPDSLSFLWDPRWKGRLSLWDDVQEIYMTAHLLGLCQYLHPERRAARADQDQAHCAEAQRAQVLGDHRRDGHPDGDRRSGRRAIRGSRQS